MRDVLELIVPWTITTTLLFACLRFDERRLVGALADRGWPPATRISAVVGFAVLAMPIHCVRTRRSPLAFVVGVVVSAGVLAIESAVEAALDALPPIDLGPDGPRATATATLLELALFYASYRIVRCASAAPPTAP